MKVTYPGPSPSAAAWLLPAALVAALVACGGSSDSATKTTSTTEPTAETAQSSSTLLPGQTQGYDDLDQDGAPDPICGTGDYGAGLVLQIPCNTAVYAPTSRPGTTPVPNSLYTLPDLTNRELLEGATAEAVQARDPAGKSVVVFFIQSDVAFEVGASALSIAAQGSLTALAHSIQSTWPSAQIQVRGHTDATGNAAANQALSEQRAVTVAGYLATQGIDGSRLSSVGLASTQPVMSETNPDGSDNPAGRTENRRVEIVVHTGR
jgi:outer membrane protein OmpA-like peptidoglycan-associated protein